MTLLSSLLSLLQVVYVIASFAMITCDASSPVLDQLSPNIQPLLEQLASTTSTTPSIETATAWKRLGKLQLDAREYAEARRVFCHGARQCPNDEQLQHHLKVWKTFHGSEGILDEEDASIEESLPLLELPSVPAKDLFLSLDVPIEAIPASIHNWKGNVPPNRRTRLLHATTEPLLSKQACHFLIKSALEATKSQGWTKDRHIQAPTCDIPVFDLPLETKRWCRHALERALLPMLAQVVAPELNINPDQLQVQDCFVVRYDAASEDPGFDSLKPHEDESLLSLTIALNDMNQYEGGGLFVQSTGDLLNGDAGTVLCFAGQLVHGGYPVSRGTRWILTVFLYVDANESGKPAGYTLEALKALLLQKDAQENQQK